MQALLRRSKYNFATANAALLACGAKISERYVKQAGGKPDPDPNPMPAGAPNGVSNGCSAEALPKLSGADERPAKRPCVAPAAAPAGCATEIAVANGHAVSCPEPPRASGQAQGADAAANGALGDHESGAQGQAADGGVLAGSPGAPRQPGSSASGHGSVVTGEAAAAGAPAEAPAPPLQPNGGAHDAAATMDVDSGAGERSGTTQQAPAGASGAEQHAPAGAAADAEAALLYCASRSARYMLDIHFTVVVHDSP